MAERPDTDSRKPGAETEREARLKRALKSNIARRKAQAKARAARACPEDEKRG